jgi:UDP-N-acetylglucosamine 1-carboxyvinyltransferase
MKFKVQGNRKLKGEVPIGGAKNAALKIIPAAILASSPCVIKNVPKISDVDKLLGILASIGAKTDFKNGEVRIDARTANSSHPDEKAVKKLRGSIVLVGPLLARFGEAEFSQPGGCLIGARPIDDHLDVFRQMGVKIEYRDEKFFLSGKPKAGHVVLKKMSVTATENAIMTSVFSDGKTSIHVAAAEPEIRDLADFLNKMGAKIRGAGTHEIEIEGVKKLDGVEYEVLPDRIEAGTYITAGIITNSEIIVGPVVSHHSDIFFKKLQDAGANFEIISRGGKEYVKTLKHGKLTAQDIDPRPYPGFPTDLQPQYAVLMTQAEGKAEIFDTLFDGRFRYLEELRLMKAKVEILNPNRITIQGPSFLKGAEVSCLDIRGGAAVVLAGLIAEGETIINNVEFIDRGYENMDGKLKGVGAGIERMD